MNGKQWVQKSVFAREAAPVPYDFMFSPPALAALGAYYGRQDVAAAIGMPMRMTGPASIKPLYAAPAKFGQTVKDEFGVVWSTSDIDRGSPTGAPLAHCDPSANLVFPDATLEYRFEHIGQWCRDSAEQYTIIWVGDLWERATFMCGMEEILLDVALNEDFVRRLLRGLADHILATMGILFERYQFDGIALSDDYGTQKAMMMSPQSWRVLIKPLLAEIYSLAHKHGRTVFHHSCGNIVPIIPDLIEVGLDILHPIQPEAMDILMLKREFGKDVAFCGGLRTQDLLPNGTPQQVRDEVRRLKDHMGKGGGYILEPGITIQADVPLANMLAMIEEARKQ